MILLTKLIGSQFYRSKSPRQAMLVVHYKFYLLWYGIERVLTYLTHYQTMKFLLLFCPIFTNIPSPVQKNARSHFYNYSILTKANEIIKWMPSSDHSIQYYSHIESWSWNRTRLPPLLIVWVPVEIVWYSSNVFVSEIVVYHYKH